MASVRPRSGCRPMTPHPREGSLGRVRAPAGIAAEGAKTPPTVVRDLGTVLLLFLCWRGLLFGADYAGRAMSVPLTNEVHYPASRFWDGYIRLDSLHYGNLVLRGYRVETEG